MPSARWRIAVWTLVLAAVTYSVVIATRPLFGVFLGALIYLVGWLVAALPSGSVAEAFSSTRAAVTGALVVGVTVYSLVIVQQILLGVLVSLTVVGVSWATAPEGPVARLLEGRGP